jgi:plasmid stabilization system protein ParE
MRFRVAPDAYDDLSQIDDWVSEHFGPSYAAKTRASLFAQFEMLTDFPHMGQQRTDISSRPIRFFFSAHYWIVYEPDVPLIIHRVIHAARDLSNQNLG